MKNKLVQLPFHQLWWEEPCHQHGGYRPCYECDKKQRRTEIAEPLQLMQEQGG